MSLVFFYEKDFTRGHSVVGKKLCYTLLNQQSCFIFSFLL